MLQLRRTVFWYVGMGLVFFSLFLAPLAFATDTQPPLGSPQASASTATGKEIVISLSQESLTAYDSGAIFLQTPVTTGGLETQTPIGTYQVLAKLQDFVMHSPWPTSDWRWYPDSFVNYGLMFQSNGYFIHDAPWRSNFGLGSNTVFGPPGGSYTGTHGCVNVPLSAEAKLYPWAQIGTPVIIQP